MFKDSFSLACAQWYNFRFLHVRNSRIYITLFPIAGVHQDRGSNPAEDNFL